MRAVRRLAVTVTLVVAGLVSAACATTIAGQGSPDPAGFDGGVGTSPGPSDTPSPGEGSGTPDPTESPTPSPSASLDPDTERRLTCILVLPPVGKAITDWNNYVDHKGGATAQTVVSSWNKSISDIEGTMERSDLPSDDKFRGQVGSLLDEMRLIVRGLQGGGSPSPTRFNSLKETVRKNCAS